MKTKINLNLFLFIILCATPVLSFTNFNLENEALVLSEPQPTLIELLEEGESFSIEITSIGCFNGTRQTLIVSKEADVYTASLKDSSKLLTPSDIQTIKSFEIELRELQMGGCTTVDTYVLRFGNETFRTSDGTCSWHGYRKLIALFS